MEWLIHYAMSFVGTPYIWMGNNPIKGWDCSGFVCEVLRSAGVVKNDKSAQMLFDFLVERSGTRRDTQQAGSVVFFGKSVSNITHVAFCIDPYRMIEAGGGNRLTREIEDAEKRNAFTRIRMVNFRSDLVECIKPGYEQIGLL